MEQVEEAQNKLQFIDYNDEENEENDEFKNGENEDDYHKKEPIEQQKQELINNNYTSSNQQVEVSPQQNQQPLPKETEEEEDEEGDLKENQQQTQLFSHTQEQTKVEENSPPSSPLFPQQPLHSNQETTGETNSISAQQEIREEEEGEKGGEEDTQKLQQRNYQTKEENEEKENLNQENREVIRETNSSESTLESKEPKQEREVTHKPIELLLSPLYTSPSSSTGATSTTTPTENRLKKKQIKRIPKKKLVENNLEGKLPPSFNKAAATEEETKTKVEKTEKNVFVTSLSCEIITKAKDKWVEIKWFAFEPRKGDFIRLIRLSTKFEQQTITFELKTEGAKEGMTHTIFPSFYGKFRAQYVRNDGKILAESTDLVIGPSVKLEAKLIEKKKMLKVKWEIKLGTGLPNSWDWIGLYQSEQDDPNKYWSYQFVNLKSNQLFFELPKKPGIWKFLYFSSASKFYWFGESNTITIDDKNLVKIETKEVLPGNVINISFNIKTVKQNRNDYIGVYKVPVTNSAKEIFDYRNDKNNYIVYKEVHGEGNLIQIVLPFNIEMGTYQCKYISYIAGPIGGEVLTLSNQFKVVEKLTVEEISMFKDGNDYNESLHFCPSCKSLQVTPNPLLCHVCGTNL